MDFKKLEELAYEASVARNQNTASFGYKKGETYPSLLEFVGRLLHVDIPIKINQCKFGPGGVIVSASSKEDAQKMLQVCTNELHALIKAKEGHID